MRKLIFILAFASSAIAQQSQIDINVRTRGNLPVARIVPGVAGQCLTTDVSGNTVWATCAAGGGSGYATIQNAATAITQRAIINWINNITCADNAGASRSDCNLASTISTAIISATTGFQVNGAAGAGKVLIGDGTNFVPGDPLVQGLFADGSTSASNPVPIGGYDTARTPALHRATFINGNPAGTEYGQIVRNIPSGTQPISGSVAVSNFPATQPVSGTLAATQSGTWTVQPGNTANTTAWKVDGSAVTQPVSASSLPLPTGAAISANQATLKSNNAAAPGTGNIGVLPAVANAAPPSLTEGNQAALSFDLAGNLRVYGHPPNVLGCYTVNGRTGTYSALSAGAILFSMRNSSSTVLEVIQRVKINVITSTAATTAGEAERELHIIRSFSASDTGGTAVTLTGNNAKMRTSQAASTVGDMRFGQPLTAGTGTADANPVSSAIAWLPLNFTGVDIGCTGAGPTGAVWACAGGYPVDLLNATNGQEYPIVLAQNEGIRITIGKDAMPAAAVQQTTVTVGWCEVNSY
jgi:hypothetical protein